MAQTIHTKKAKNLAQETSTDKMRTAQAIIWNTGEELKRVSVSSLVDENVMKDATPTQDSTNPVESGGVHAALGGKQDTSDKVQDMSAVAAGDKATKYPSVAAVEAALGSADVSITAVSSPPAITGEVDICRYPITDTTTTIALTITPTTVASGKAKSVEIILDNTANTLNCMATVTLTDTTNWTLYNDAQTLEVLAGERLVLNVQMINDGAAQIVMLN